ncbi:RepB family plasmid replication initiator protein [Pseudomonas sp. WS 5096]|uniref:RepB family plasmid replication initiator protein n=1 Tax=Pseudomonas cremoris TaxID=2724178 RepID=A0ABR6THZ4_9PSED|nr:replication protein C, IncQ-type [Pseudomonas cremoris]MBC2385596.1 RepB family plasmid replication initiator protein [Pseudomonas cremoris]
MDTTNNTKVTFARTDRATATASLFRPITRGRRPTGLKVFADYDETKLTFTSYDWLDSRDQTILLALIGMAGIESVNISADSSGEIGKKLWAGLNPLNSALGDYGAVVETTMYKLLQASGMNDDTKTYTRVKEILDRLSQVNCKAQSDGWQWSMRFLSYAFHEDGTLAVALNARFAQALAQGSTYARINLEERRQLDGDIAQLVHSWLNATVRAGNTFKIGIDKLAVRVWGVESQNDATNRKRRTLVIAALEEIKSLKSWKVDISGRGVDAMATIKRPKMIGF